MVGIDGVDGVVVGVVVEGVVLVVDVVLEVDDSFPPPWHMGNLL